jgi:phosphoribosylformylglycinamidine synthase
MIARVYVTLKAGVLDPQGRAIARALVADGFGEVQDARVGKLIEVKLEETDPAKAKERLKEMCEKLLANTVIERYDIEIPNS